MTLRMWITACGLVLLAAMSAAQQEVPQRKDASPKKEAPPAAGTPRDFVLPKPSRFALPNGLRVTLAPFGDVPKVTVRLVVDAGNVHEAKDQVWLADLTGRLMQEGTDALTADALARELAGMGGQLGVSVGPDTTSITTDVLSEQKGYTYSPGSSVRPHVNDAAWVEAADVTTAHTGDSVKEILHEIRRLQEQAPAAEELQGIKNTLAGIFVVQNASRSGVISQLAFVDLHDLGDDYLTQYVKRVMSVSPEVIQKMVHKYLAPDRMTLVAVGDTKTVKEQLAPWSAGPK